MIHETALIDEGVEIGEGTQVWHYAVIRKGAKIGKNCIICQHVFIDCGVIIGDGCKIKNGAMLFKGVKIEENVFVGPGVVFTNVINPRAEIDRKLEIKDTLVKKGVTIGANATILCGITLWDYSFIGAGSVVTKSVGDYELVYGIPARFRKVIDKLAIF